MDTRSSRGSSRVTAEYDPFGQVIITEAAGGKYSLRSRTGSDDVHPSILPADGSVDRPNGDVAGERPPTPRSTPVSPQQYRRRAESLADEATTGGGGGAGGSVSSASSSVVRRIGRRRKRRHDDDSESESTARYSDFSRGQSKRGGGGVRRHRRKKKNHKARSIDKHGDDAAARRYSAPEPDDAGGPDNDYWRSLVAEQHRRSSLDVPQRRRRRGGASPRRRSADGSGRRASEVNGTGPVPGAGTGSGGQLDVNGNVRVLSDRGRRYSGAAAKMDSDRRGCCAMVPAVMFIVVGCLLVVVGVIRVFICFWHEFGSSVWSGALVREPPL